MSFPRVLEAQILAGGRFPHLPAGEVEPPAKGMVPVGGLPMAARALQAVKASVRVERTILVSSSGEWPEADQVVPEGRNILESFGNGLKAARYPELPMLSVTGDLPFLTPEAVTDFVDRCSRRPEVDVWYGFLRREHSERAYPGTRHTWARFFEGTFCGTGLFLIRPAVFGRVERALAEITRQRKNVLALARIMGIGVVFRYLLRRLTIRQAEWAGQRVLGGVPCAGIETPFPESAFNVDDLETLLEARRICPSGGPP